MVISFAHTLILIDRFSITTVSLLLWTRIVINCFILGTFATRVLCHIIAFAEVTDSLRTCCGTRGYENCHPGRFTMKFAREFYIVLPGVYFVLCRWFNKLLILNSSWIIYTGYNVHGKDEPCKVTSKQLLLYFRYD